MNWLYHYAGINGSGPWYGFWSGIGSDIGELAILGGVIQLVRHRNCHVKGCLRFGKPVDGTPYLACHRHHPAHEGDRRSVSLETIHAAHAAAKPKPAPKTRSTK